MKQTIPYGETHETREGTALYDAIGAAIYWQKKSKTSFHDGFRVGFLVSAAVAIAITLIWEFGKWLA